jgi:hypothetical protein
MLAETEDKRAKGARGIGPIAVTYSDHNTPTLAELGVSKREGIQSYSLTAYVQRRDTISMPVGSA